MTGSVPQRGEHPDSLLAAIHKAWGDHRGRPIQTQVESGDYFFIFIASCTGSFTFGMLPISTLTSLPPTLATRLI